MKAIARENSSSSKKCAFCKYWYDPTNSAIRPSFGRGVWEYDADAKCKCRVKNRDTKGFESCPKFESKL